MKSSMHVFSNLAMSLDGKIAPVDQPMYSLGTKKDLDWLHTLRNQADIVVMGAGTVRAFQRPCLPKKRRDFFANALLTRTGENLDPKWPFFKARNLERFIFYTGKMKPKLQDAFLESSHLIPLDPKKSSAEQMIAVLQILNFQKILVEGGGELMWEFVKKNLIDDYYVTLTPKILGGVKAPSLVSGAGFPGGNELNLKLKEAKIVKDEVFLHYRRKKSSP
jgi:riboflavin-specific deaminase-like protein